MKVDLSELFKGNEDSDKAIMRTLLRAIKEEHKNEFDYLSFKQSIKNLGSMDLDTVTKFKSAYATASTLGITKDKLIKSAKAYQYALENEQTSFANALKHQLEVKVHGKKDDAEKYKKKIAEYKEKIAKMEKDIKVFENEIDKVDEKMAEAKSKIDNTKNKFEKTFSSVYNTIKEDIGLIDQYL
jgi:chromosome segregation ATPase